MSFILEAGVKFLSIDGFLTLFDSSPAKRESSGGRDNKLRRFRTGCGCPLSGPLDI